MPHVYSKLATYLNNIRGKVTSAEISWNLDVPTLKSRKITQVKILLGIYGVKIHLV